ncbi:MAG: methyl-accepting chemotaxis protein [Proteobacteria bacterium]|nr:MAG: methyl-accepting chemotaxis protein [Pseudomonadota bacterium]
MSTKSKRDIQGGIISIRSRVALSVTAPLLILALVSGMGIWALLSASEALVNLNHSGVKLQATTHIKNSLQDAIEAPLYNIRLGSAAPKTEWLSLKTEREKFDKEWQDYLGLIKDTSPEVLTRLTEGKTRLDQGLDKISTTLEEIKASDGASSHAYPPKVHQMAYEIIGTSHALNDLFTNLITESWDENKQVYEASKGNIDLSTAVIATAVMLGLIFVMAIGTLLHSSIAGPVTHLTTVVSDLARGDETARSRLKGRDELSQLGNAFNAMMDEHNALKQQVDHDNEVINHSVFSLLEAVADLSERDLTVRAKVTEDATGPLADAINQLAEDTTKVLEKVKDIAGSVDTTSAIVNERSQSVNALAKEEQKEVEAAAKQIEQIRHRLEVIAQSALQTNDLAGKTSDTTQHAYQSVSRSMSSMSEIRDTVQDTGKRIKRLGERSQEISYITDIINGIAERTTVLALNANMQAMAAGDAGKGFSVIADEIQRLAESSRESTEQISTLVKNIQQETKSTIATMDHTIEQVVEGSALADEASRQMQETLDATNQLTESVNDIASASKEQMEMGETLQSSASRIIETTKATGQEMGLLAQLTSDMTDYAKQLVESVNVFKLKS